MAPPVDARLVDALQRQLEGRRAALARGARRVGWKLGVGDGERIGEELAVGYLTSASELAPDATYPAAGARLSADVEVAVRLARPLPAAAGVEAAQRAIDGYAAAVELVDLQDAPDDPAGVVAANVYHRAVAFGPWQARLPASLEARLVIDGAVRADARPRVDVPALVLAAARLLEAVGERLEAGDRLITGNLAQVRVATGEHVVAEVDGLGAAGLVIGS